MDVVCGDAGHGVGHAGYCEGAEGYTMWCDCRCGAGGRIVAVGFAGVRNYKGSCMCMGLFRRGLSSPTEISVCIDSERFKVNSSKLVAVNPSNGTSFEVEVCGTSNSRTRVYKGNVHYITGCICSRGLASGARVSIRAKTNVGCLALCIRRGGMSRIHISVNRPVLAPKSVPIIGTSKDTCDSSCEMVSRPVSTNGER